MLIDNFAEPKDTLIDDFDHCKALRLFQLISRPELKYIEEEDLLKFFEKEEGELLSQKMGLNGGKLKKFEFRDWLREIHRKQKALVFSIKDTKKIVRDLNRMTSAVVALIILIISFIVMGMETTKVLLVFSSQLLVFGFIVQNTYSQIFGSIIFVFLMHPFDVGDHCVIDGNQMIVEEMHVMSTEFLRLDNERIYYPNTVLLTKSISNYNRSSEMGETIEFSVDVSTSKKTVANLKRLIGEYLEKKPVYWQKKYSLVVKEFDDNKMKMNLNVMHTITYQNFLKKNKRRSQLHFALKRFLKKVENKEL